MSEHEVKSPDELALEVLSKMFETEALIETLKSDSRFNTRALSIALTELQTAQLWVANARPE